MYKLGMDVMGADLGPKPAISAAIKYVKKNKDMHVVLIGDSDAINNELKKYRYKKTQISVKPTTQEITMNDGIIDIRRKTDASMVVALEMVKKNEVNGMLTGGNSAAFIAGSHFILKEFEGVSRPGFMPTLPTILNNKTTLLIDAGANIENDPIDLYSFAKLASVYLKSIKGIDIPKVGLINIGSESHKGKSLEKETYKLLSEEKEHFYFEGNIEPRDMTSGKVDILVTDGWTGNIALKSIEGMGKNLLTEIKKQITKGLRFLATIFLVNAFRAVKKKFDYKNHAGAILIGINGIVFKSHGSSDEKCFLATLRMTGDAVRADVVEKMRELFK